MKLSQSTIHVIALHGFISYRIAFPISLILDSAACCPAYSAMDSCCELQYRSSSHYDLALMDCNHLVSPALLVRGGVYLHLDSLIFAFIFTFTFFYQLFFHPRSDFCNFISTDYCYCVKFFLLKQLKYLKPIT